MKLSGDGRASDLSAEHRCKLEPVPRKPASDPDARVLGMTIDRKVLVFGHGVHTNSMTLTAVGAMKVIA